MKKYASPYGATSRSKVVLTLLGVFALLVLGRVVYLQVYNSEFLVKQGDSRFVRIKKEPALRGTIFDRNAIPLAVSTPAKSLWANPQELLKHPQDIIQLANDIGTSYSALSKKLYKKRNSHFVYLERGLEPQVANTILSKKYAGVYSLREYRRYYPSGDVISQVIGYNNIDDEGQEGIELGHNDWLSGTSGSSEIIRDLNGKVVDILEEITPPVQGQPLTLTLDKRLQYLTYVALLEVTEKFRATAATAVMLSAKTSEVLAMVSVPSGNPNIQEERRASLIKNRALTDIFEPGSALKPFTVASALDTHVVTPKTPIDTEKGYFPIDGRVVKDVHDYGRLTVEGVIRKSSNVGTCKIALRIPKEKLLATYRSLGFGKKTATGFPGEQKGTLRDFSKISDFDYCTNSYGYGTSVNALQLAQAYAVLANDGVRIPATLIKRERTAPGERIFSKTTARQVRKMLESAVSQEGTGKLATKGEYISDYTVGGKTGTVHKVINGKYAKKRYLSVFAGIAPINNPEIVMVIIVDDPKGKKYYGGLVAAPVFAKVVGKSLRILGIEPDRKPSTHENEKIHINRTSP